MADEPTSPPARAKKSDDPIVMVVGQSVTFAIGFIDGMEDTLGPMPAPAAGAVTVDTPNVVNASATITGGVEPQARVRLEAINLGKANVNYRLDDIALTIPVEVVRRVPKSIVVQHDSIVRAPL